MCLNKQYVRITCLEAENNQNCFIVRPIILFN